ncbi:MAG: TIGR04211 family SH3 domain-containing protein [Gammaproteobacteria bacterium]|nr:TIGR04211 family SH3 domain-containing protein [Gammaproteobacteria bacterium]
MKLHRSVFLTVMFSGAIFAQSEIVYVTDELRLGVHEAADTNDQPFAYAISGDALEVITWARPFVRVRLQDGTEGWVRAAFLVDEEPARSRIVRVESARDELAAELDAIRGGRDTQKEKLAALQQELGDARAQAQAAESSLHELRDEHAGALKRLEAFGFAVPMSWAIGGAGITLLLGICIAWWWFDRRSRRRHGGFRIY